MMKRKITGPRFFAVLLSFIPAFFFFLPQRTGAQEFNCNVSVATQQIQGTNKDIFETLRKTIYEFMNNRNWTNHVYEYNERIECSILINITDQISSDDFSGTIQVQASRPVYNSTYTTTMLNIKDNNLRFKYVEDEPLEFNETVHGSNLSSILAYYAYIILGLDYDSFGYEGGTEYFEKAEKIVNNAQNATESGWKPYEGNFKNRYWLIHNILDANYDPFREFSYKYHRLGLDVMTEQSSTGRAAIAESLKLLQKVYREKPDSYLYLLQVILDAKSDEFVKIFETTKSTLDERNRVYKILTEIDPSNIDNYKGILDPQSE